MSYLLWFYYICTPHTYAISNCVLTYHRTGHDSKPYLLFIWTHRRINMSRRSLQGYDWHPFIMGPSSLPRPSPFQNPSGAGNKFIWSELQIALTGLVSASFMRRSDLRLCRELFRRPVGVFYESQMPAAFWRDQRVTHSCRPYRWIIQPWRRRVPFYDGRLTSRDAAIFRYKLIKLACTSVICPPVTH